MNIRVAVRAMRACVAEHQAGVTLLACNLFVHATKRIPRVVMTEFGNRPRRFPARVCVAVLARNGQRTVRVGYLGSRIDRVGERFYRRPLKACPDQYDCHHDPE